MTASVDAGDPGVEVLGHPERRSPIRVAVEQERRHVDPRKHVAQVRLGQGVRHRPVSGRVELGHHRDDLIDQLRGRGFGEQPRDPARHELIGRQVGLPQRLLRGAASTTSAGREPAQPA